MPDLDFKVEGVEDVKFAAAPLLNFKLRVTNRGDEPIHTVALKAQIQITPTRRHYDKSEQEPLRDLFGEPERWSQTVRSFLWTFSSVIVPPFSGETVVDLPVPCTFDFNVAATKYFGALQDGEVPIELLFSGTIFFEGEDGALQVAQISWTKEATFRLPVQTWRAMMAHYYPNSAWLNLHQDTFDRLYRYKIRNSLPTWEQAIENLLPEES